MESISSKNQKIIYSICAFLILIIISSLAYAFWPQSDNKTSKNKQSDNVEVTTTSQSSTTTTPSSETDSTTTTSKVKVNRDTSTTSSTTTTLQSTTTQPAFSPTATVSNPVLSINQCISAQYTFTASIHTNVPGSVDWVWIREDGVETGVSGNITVTNNDVTTDSITPYVFTKSIGIDPEITGWVALKLTWPGGTFISPHSEYVVSYVQISTGHSVVQGC